MDYTSIKYEKSAGVLTITLNRPEKLNALTDSGTRELMDAFDRADEDDEVRAIIVTGAGRAFCAGQDLGEGERTFDYSRIPDETLESWRDQGGVAILRIYEMKKPMIAAINGPAVGVGITMTLPMDIRLASDRAKMGFVFARRGIILESCSTWFLSRITNMGKAAEWAYTGRVFDAYEALAGGLVTEVLAPEALLPKANAIAREIADNTSAISVALNRQMLWKMLGADHPMEAHRIESKGMYWLGASADAHEGVAAWVEKRKPQFPLKPSTDMPPYYPWWKERPF